MSAARDPQGTGDCYHVAADLVVWTAEFEHDETARICHAYVTHPERGYRHSHAWVETTQVYELPEWPHPIISTVCYDRSNGHNVALPASLYYKLGDIDPACVLRYDRYEAAEHMRRTGTYGPWQRRVLDRLEAQR
jgi:hypothetical protein